VSVEDEQTAALVVAQDLDVHPGGFGDLPAAQARTHRGTCVPARVRPGFAGAWRTLGLGTQQLAMAWP
jgi:hypothetical protein